MRGPIIQSVRRVAGLRTRRRARRPLTHPYRERGAQKKPLQAGQGPVKALVATHGRSQAIILTKEFDIANNFGNILLMATNTRRLAVE